jgi:hypothetical protein
MQNIKYYFLIVSCVLFSFAGVASATVSTGTSSAWDAVTYDSTIEFNAVLNSSGNVEATWSKYDKSNNFTYYKLVRSSTVTSPVYPDNGYIYYSSDVDVLSYTDKSVPTGTSYYRICQIASPARYCSEKVVAITKASTTNIDNSQINLAGAIDGTTIKLSWTLVNSSATSFKVVWGKSQNPVYPNRSTDSYHYLSSGENSDTITGLANGKYYARVCIYENGVCIKYSNEIVAEINNVSDSSQNPNTVTVCNDVYAPVCGNDNKTYSNTCYAKKNGVTNYTNGKCATETTVTNPTINSLGITLDKPLDQMNRNELIKVLITILMVLLSK